MKSAVVIVFFLLVTGLNEKNQIQGDNSSAEEDLSVTESDISYLNYPNEFADFFEDSLFSLKDSGSNFNSWNLNVKMVVRETLSKEYNYILVLTKGTVALNESTGDMKNILKFEPFGEAANDLRNPANDVHIVSRSLQINYYWKKDLQKTSYSKGGDKEDVTSKLAVAKCDYIICKPIPVQSLNSYEKQVMNDWRDGVVMKINEIIDNLNEAMKTYKQP